MTLHDAHALALAFAGPDPSAVPWMTPDGARHQCLIASALFAAYCAAGGAAPKVWQLAGRPHSRVPLPDPAGDYRHVVVQLGDAVIDWTARQFDPTLPCPLVEARATPWPSYWEGRVAEHQLMALDWAALAARTQAPGD